MGKRKRLHPFCFDHLGCQRDSVRDIGDGRAHTCVSVSAPHLIIQTEGKTYPKAWVLSRAGK